uniref:Cornetto n=1 Tax=Timema tahoe TaxID=61484 RepID=A0A7R9IR32_9NEOP|nr:unnamed protein product [Timema tahoe]
MDCSENSSLPSTSLFTLCDGQQRTSEDQSSDIPVVKDRTSNCRIEKKDVSGTLGQFHSLAMEEVLIGKGCVTVSGQCASLSENNEPNILCSAGCLTNNAIENVPLKENNINNNGEIVNSNVDVTSLENSLSRQKNKPNKTISPDSCLTLGTIANVGMKLCRDINKEGSDSGVEVNGAHESLPCLQRISSGLEDSNISSTMSCDSSLISYYSSSYQDAEDLVTGTTMVLPPSGDGTSEAGSESSSITSKDAGQGMKIGTSSIFMKRKTDLTSVLKKSTTNRQTTSTPSAVSSARTRVITSSGQPSFTDKTTTLGSINKPTAISNCRKEKVALSTSIKGVASKLVQQGLSSRASRPNSSSSTGMSKGHSRTSGNITVNVSDKNVVSQSKGRGLFRAVKAKVSSNMPNNDGRWPSSIHRPQPSSTKSREGSIMENTIKKTVATSTIGMGEDTIMESKASALEKYATLPRRRRYQSPETSVTEVHLRSQSTGRDPSLNRAASLRKQLQVREPPKSLPPYPRHHRTRIYHETSIQTVLTGDDVERALTGTMLLDRTSFRTNQLLDQQVQTEDRLQEHLEDLVILKAECQRQRKEMSQKEECQIQTLTRLQQMEQSLGTMLATVKGKQNDTETGQLNCLQELEDHILSSNHIIAKQQQEIAELQIIRRKLEQVLFHQNTIVGAYGSAHLDVHLTESSSEQYLESRTETEQSLSAHQSLLHQQQEIEVESVELQDFLLAEKTTLAEALKEAEAEVEHQKSEVAQRNCELERQQEECRHLVRISEQRRQENLALQSKLRSLEQCSKDLLLQQGAAMSGAAVALSGLGSRLDGLVEQLASSYNISEKDLEDVIFHNEAYSKSNSSVEVSPEKSSSLHSSESVFRTKQTTPSPKRGASFVSAVISAIRNTAAHSARTQTVEKQQFPSSQPSQPVSDTPTQTDSSPELSELLDLEKDPCLAVESEDYQMSSDSSVGSRLNNSESLQNLSQAILGRQQVDAMLSQEHSCYMPTVTLVDQFERNFNVKEMPYIGLGILRGLQLSEQMNQNQESRLEETRHLNGAVAKLRKELQEARAKLQTTVFEIDRAHAESHRQQDTVQIPLLQEKLSEKEHQLTELTQKFSNSKQLLSENLHQAALELRRQYEAIDAALETLHSIQSIVLQCPPLAKLQRDLEETNFQCASSLPIMMPDLNANAALATNIVPHNPINGTV